MTVADPMVRIAQGSLRGRSVNGGVWRFAGIPYAAAPVGALRWRPPAEAPSWPGVREAEAFGADPIQPAGLRISRAPGASEDCLYLNVWAPKERCRQGWPVLVWSCGGAFTTGSGAFTEEDPAKLAARGAVVVSFNVRLNVFGFLAHPALSAESPHGSSGNYGLLDQAAGLSWVRDNIAQFGGNAGNVTFFGESAGATMGMLLLACPLVKASYDRAIFQSPGSFGQLLSLAEAERHGAPLGASAEEIRAIPASDLLQRAGKLAAVSPLLWRARPLRPIADGWVMRTTEPMREGNFDAVPAIIGTNEDEGRFFGPRMRITTLAVYKAFLGDIFVAHADEAWRHYPARDDADVSDMFSQVYGDRGFNYPIRELARTFARSGVDTYRYVYTYRHGTTGRVPTHSEENGVLMDLLPHTTRGDAEMSGTMARLWLAFAASGNPNHADLLPWPCYDEATDQHMRLDVPLSTGSGWRSADVDFVRDAAADLLAGTGERVIGEAAR